MPVLFDFLYREYCHARLAEMRKHLLLIANDVPEPNCDADHADRAPDRQRSSSGAKNQPDPDHLV
jgi:hypothetical protein